MLVSTPKGKRGAFYRAWTFGGDDWERVFGPVDVTNPERISRKFLEVNGGSGAMTTWRKSMGASFWTGIASVWR